MMLQCELLEWRAMAYILSLAFQVAGAVLLIIKYWGRTRERIIDEYFPGSNVIERDKNNNVKLQKDKVQECARRIYDNRAAFLFIAVGYILSIFGEMQGKCKVCVLAFVISSTVIIIILEKNWSYIAAEYFYKEDIPLKYDDIKEKADTCITSSEVDDMFQDRERNK